MRRSITPFFLKAASTLCFFLAVPFLAALAQPKVLTPGRLTITESSPIEGVDLVPQLDEKEGMMRFSIDPKLGKYVKPADLERWFRESRIEIQGLTYDRNKVRASGSGDVNVRFTFDFMSSQDEIQRRVQIKNVDLFRTYYQSHKIYKQRISLYTIGLAEEPVLEQDAEGTIVVKTGTVTDVDIEAVRDDGLLRKFLVQEFKLPVGAWTLTISKQGFESTRQRVNVQNDRSVEVSVTLKAVPRNVPSNVTATQAAPVVEAKFKESIINRLLATKTLTGRRPAIGAVFSPDGTQLITWHTDNLIYVWPDLTKNTFSTVLAGHTSEVKSVSFFPEQNILFTYSESQVITYDLKTLKVLTIVQARDLAKAGIASAVYLPEPPTAIVTSKDNTFRSYSYNSKTTTPEAADDATSNAAVLLPNKRSYASLSGNGIVRIRIGSSGGGRTLNATGNLVKGFISSNQKYLVVSSEDQVFTDNTVSVFDVNSNGSNPLAAVTASSAMAVFDNMLVVAAENTSRALSLFDATSGKVVYSASTITVGEKFGAISSDGKFFVTNGKDNEILLYELDRLDEWQFALQFSAAFDAVTEQAKGLTTIKSRLVKPTSMFVDAAAKRKYDDLLDGSLAKLYAERDKAFMELRNAQNSYFEILSSMDQKLGPQQQIETRPEYERRMEDALGKIGKGKDVYNQAVTVEVANLKTALLKGIVFEQTNESVSFPTIFGTYDQTEEYLPVTVNNLRSYIRISGSDVDYWKKAFQEKGWQIERSDVTIEPVTYKLYLQAEENGEKAYLGGVNFSFSTPISDIYVNHFTIDLKANGYITFSLNDKKSEVVATAVKDGVSKVVTLSGSPSPTPFRPGLYDLQINSKNNKPIYWRTQISPGVFDGLQFEQVGIKKQSATLVLRGTEFPYVVTITKPDQKILKYTIWSDYASLEFPKGIYRLAYAKEGYAIEGKGSVSLVNGGTEEIVLKFSKRSADGKLVAVNAALGQAPARQAAPVQALGGVTPPSVSGAKPAVSTPPVQNNVAVAPKKKRNGWKWLLFFAAAGGAGWYLTQPDAGVSPLPTPPAGPTGS